MTCAAFDRSVPPNNALQTDKGNPGLYLHQLKGKDHGVWSVRVSGNWRITFRFEGPDAIDVNYEDYH